MWVVLCNAGCVSWCVALHVVLYGVLCMLYGVYYVLRVVSGVV